MIFKKKEVNHINDFLSFALNKEIKSIIKDERILLSCKVDKINRKNKKQ